MPHDESTSSGLFFEKRAQAEDGRFFRDLRGREAGDFLKGATPDPTFLWDEPVADGFHRPARQQPEALEYGGERFHASDANAGTGVVSEPAEGAGASPSPASPSAPMGKQASVRLRFLGTSFQKSALQAPTRKDVGDAYDQAREIGGRALEAGKVYGTKALETGKELGGKVLDHAARYGGQALETLRGSGEGLGDKTNEILDAASKHPVGATAMVGGAGLLGARAIGGAARGVARGAGALFRRRKPVPKGLVSRGLAGLQHLLHG